MELLKLVDLDIEGLITELRGMWLSHPDYAQNPNAFNKIKSLGDDFQICCPFHPERNPSFGISKSYPYKYNCFVCGNSSNSILDLVAHAMNAKSTIPATAFMKDFIGVEIVTRKKLGLTFEKNKPKESTGYELLEKWQDSKHPYFYQRGFSDLAIERYGVCYDKDNDHMLIPVRDVNGTLRFVKKRGVSRKVFLNDKGIYKKDILFGLDIIKRAGFDLFKDITLVESETDVIALHSGGVVATATMGKNLSKEQALLLAHSGIPTIKLLFDNDFWGRVATLQAISVLSKYPMKLLVGLFPGKNYGIDAIEDIGIKDGNDLRKLGLIEKTQFISIDKYLSLLDSSIKAEIAEKAKFSPF